MTKKNKVVLSVLLVVCFILLIIKNYQYRQNIRESGVYVIGIVQNTKPAYKGIRTYVIYTYQGKQFKSDYISNGININDVGKKFFFKINPNKPSEYLVEYNIPVPNSLKESPYNGWDTLPLNFMK